MKPYRVTRLTIVLLALYALAVDLLVTGMAVWRLWPAR